MGHLAFPGGCRLGGYRPWRSKNLRYSVFTLVSLHGTLDIKSSSPLPASSRQPDLTVPVPKYDPSLKPHRPESAPGSSSLGTVLSVLLGQLRLASHQLGEEAGIPS